MAGMGAEMVARGAVFLAMAALAGLAPCAAAHAAPSSVAPFAQGERVTFLGDSITHGGTFHANLQLFWDLRFPGSGTRLMNCGISGDTAGGGAARWGYDVVPQNADRVFVMFGMNDVGHGYYKPGTVVDEKVAEGRKASLAAYTRNMAKIADEVKAAGKGLVVMTPTPYDEYGDLHTAERRVDCNSLGLASFAAACRALAAERGAETVELYAPFSRLVRGNRKSTFCRPDRVHPTVEGHVVVMALVLEAMGVSPVVAKVEIGADGRVETSERAKVSEVAAAQGGISFRYEPKTLPYPVTDEYRRADAMYPVSAGMNMETLKITGLETGDYDLAADGSPLGTFSAERLAEGVNLALLPTPGAKMAAEAWKISRELAKVQSRQRTLVLIEKVAAMRGAKADDFDDVCAKMEAYVRKLNEGNPPIGRYYSGQLAAYRSDRHRAAELRAEEDNCRRRLSEAAARKASYVISLRRKQPSS